MSERVNQLRTQRKVQQGPASRACGMCNACCITLGVEEIDKEENEPCKHLAAKGCAIYESRPQSCRDYVCLWRAGLLEGAERPDRIGFTVDVANDIPDLLLARELRKGAFEENRAVLDRLATHAVVVMLRPVSIARRSVRRTRSRRTWNTHAED
jgi:hypothetical protein